MLDQVKLLHSTARVRTRFGETPRFAEGLYELADGIYTWLVPNGSWGETNAGLIAASDRSLLIDTPWDLGFTRDLQAAMTVVTDGRPIRSVVNTHSDGDHCWGNQCFEDREIIASEATASAMRHVSPASLVAFGRLGRALGMLPVRRAQQIGAWFAGMTAPYDFSSVRLTLPNRVFRGELTLNLAGRDVVLRELGPAHTDGDTIVFVPDARVLFSGDLLFVDSTPPMWAGPIEHWLSALDAILAYDARIIVPGHGPPTTHEGVLRMRGYLEFVAEHTLRHHQSGMPPTAAARQIVSDSRFTALGFGTWDSPERVMTTVHSIYRHAGYTAWGPGPLGMLRMFAAQAELAAEFRDAAPRSMHACVRARDATAQHAE